jgi:hypothetical protein
LIKYFSTRLKFTLSVLAASSFTVFTVIMFIQLLFFLNST